MGAIFAVPLVILGGVALYTLTGNSIGSFAPAQLPLLVLLAFQNILFGPLGEEFGWRGFALPKLQSRFSAFWSSVILGIMHTFWHLPLFFLGGVTFGTIEENGLITIPLFLSWVMIGTFVYTFALNNTKGSLIIAVLIHLMVNSDAIVFGVFPTLSESAQFQIMALAQIPGWIVVLLLILVFGPTNLSRKNKRSGR